MTNIRLITHADVAAVVALHDEGCLESAGHRMNERTRDNVRKMFTRYVDNLLAYAYIVEADGKAIGYGSCSISHHPAMSGAIGEIEEVFILPDYRRRGIATQLVKTMQSTLYESKVFFIRTLACVDSPIAKFFWASLGYENDLTAFNLYNND